MRIVLMRFVAVSLLLAAAAPSAPRSETQVRRYLLSAGANNGGRDKVVLRYAVSDANAFAAVLTDMGGVSKNDAIILSDPSRKELLSGIDRLAALVSAGDKNVRHEVFVYYSGHADEEGLKLAGETLSWADFRSAVNSLDADIRVAVLDACGSGAITRTKGGVARPAFLSDASMNMKGYAFLTSSNENEASQESDRIKGSYFTHALLSGLRGAADMAGDGRVTINEAYQYAFNETLQNTQNTRAGTQHPSRDMNLAGTGDIVMTDLRRTSATLSLDADIEGRFFIRDENGGLFAELRKMRGRPIELGIPPGKYTVQMEAPSRMWSAGNVVINDGGKTVITMNDMRPMGARKRTVARGGEDAEDGDDLEYFDEEDEGVFVEYSCDDYGLPADIAMACREEAANLAVTAGALSPEDTSSSEGERSASAAKIANPMLDAACRAPYRFNFNAIAASNEPESGVQLSFVNIANTSYCGSQIGLVNTFNRDSRGVQIGFANLSNGTINGLDGAQIGAVNVAASSDVRIQVGSVNVARDVDVLQIGYVNVARDAEKLQFGTVNVVSGRVNVQIGAVNVARKASRPIGVVNVAAHSENTPIGVLSVVGNGIIDATAYFDVSDDRTLSLRAGMPWFYTMFDISERTSYTDRDGSYPALAGWGVGTRFGMNGALVLNLEAVMQRLVDPYDGGKAERRESDWRFRNYYKARFGANYSPLPFLAIAAGVSASGKMECDFDKKWNEPSNNFGNWRSEKDDRGHYFHAWPGLYAGISVGKVRASR